jgi:uncharacterized protein (TIGR03000 family)
MYSVVLMVAMTTSPDVPDFGRRRGCHGGGGYACSGWSGGSGYGCRGGYGGYGYGCMGGYGGGYGGCYGGGGYGCSGGGGYGCSGGGRYGYSGGGYGFSGGGYSGGGYSGSSPYYGTMPYMGGMPYYNGGSGYNSTNLEGDETSARATITVRLPADAKLTIDGDPTTSTSSERQFITPPLPRGKEYTYQLRAEVQRNGKTVVATKKVPVEAGRDTQVELFPATEGVSSK